MTIIIEITINCDWDTGNRINHLIKKILRENNYDKYGLIKGYTNKIREEK